MKTSLLLLLEDFLDGKVDVYTMEAFTSDVYFNTYKPDVIDKTDPELSLVFDTVADLSYYYQKSKRDKTVLKRYDQSLNILQEYL